MATKILRLPSVKDRTGLSRSTIYLRVKQGGFPKPISLGPRSVGWPETEIESWLSNRIPCSRSSEQTDHSEDIDKAPDPTDEGHRSRHAS